MRLHLSRGTCATAARQDKLALGGARVLRGRNKSKRTERRDDNARKGREVGARRTGSARCVATRAAKGFGLGTGTQRSAKIPNGYLRVAELSSLEEKPNGREAVILGKWRVIVFSFEGELFITEANSTAFEFPLIDAEIVRSEDDEIIIETPLDGTTYNLRTGEVIEWCPKNNLFRNLLGTLKEKEKPVPLKVYPVVIGQDGAIYTSKKNIK